MNRQQSFQNSLATLYVIATPIGNLNEISPRVIEAITDSQYVFCEDTRVTGQLLSQLKIKKPLISAYENIEKQSAEKVIQHLSQHENVAFMSDAGYPGISDPGQIVIKEAIEHQFNVVVVNGPCALIQSVIASGFDTKHFYFYGFLDAKPTLRKKELESLKNFSNTLIFYQSPHKILACLQDMLEIFGNRKICVCRELTKKFEEYIRGSIQEIIPLCETFKGEMVIVVEGYQEKEIQTITLDEAIQRVQQMIQKGFLKTKAIKQIANDYHLSRKELYQYYHQQTNEKGE